MVRLLLAAIAVAAAVLVLGSLVDDDAGRDRPSSPSDVTRTAPQIVPAPSLTAREIDRQDRPDRRRQHVEARVFDRRPLLSALPAVLHGVRFEIGGLAADQRTTIVRADAGRLDRRRAELAFEMLIRRTQDRSRSYELLVAR